MAVRLAAGGTIRPPVGVDEYPVVVDLPQMFRTNTAVMNEVGEVRIRRHGLSIRRRAARRLTNPGEDLRATPDGRSVRGRPVRCYGVTSIPRGRWNPALEYCDADSRAVHGQTEKARPRARWIW